MSTRPERLADAIHVLLRVITVDETRHPSAEGRMRYNPLDFQTIARVRAEPGIRAADLARFLGVAPTTLQSAVDRLVRRGVIEKGAGGRGLGLTEEGEALAAAIRRQDVANMKTALDALPTARRAAMVEDLERIAAAVSGGMD